MVSQLFQSVRSKNGMSNCMLISTVQYKQASLYWNLFLLMCCTYTNSAHIGH